MHKNIALLVAIAFIVSGCSLPSWMGGSPKAKEKLTGDRIAILAINAQLDPDKSLADKRPSFPPAAANTQWAQHTGEITAQTANLVGGAFDKSISVRAGAGNAFEHVMIPRPVVAGGAVFAIDAVGHISAHDVSDIRRVLWQSAGVSQEDSPQMLGGGMAWEQGVLYAVSGRGVVAAFDAASGKEQWKKNLHIPFRSAPKVAGGKIFVTSIDNQLYALSVSNGDIVWTGRGINETAGLMNAISPAVAGEAVIVPFSSGEIYALALTDGHELWNDSIAASARTQASNSFSGIGGDPVIDGPVVFVVGAGGMTSAVSLADGKRVWDKPVGAFNTPWVAGNTLFILASDNTVAALEKTSGKVYWATALPSFGDMEDKDDPILWRGPMLVDNRIAVVGSNGQLLFLSAEDGKIMQTVSVAEHIYTPPVVAGGRMYLIAQDATLYELQ